MEAFVGGFSGVKTTSLLPGTRTMYRTSGSLTSCVGFRGYCGGFERRDVSEAKDSASTAVVVIDVRLGMTLASVIVVGRACFEMGSVQIKIERIINGAGKR